MAFCSACGRENADEARFCTACGQQIPANAPPLPTQPATPVAPPQPPSHSFYQPVQQPIAQPGGSGMGVAGMILGIIGVVFAFIPLVGPFIAFPCIAVGMPLSIIGFVRNRRRGQGKGMAIAGMVCNAVALLMTIISVAITVAAVSEADEAFNRVGSEQPTAAARRVEATPSATTDTPVRLPLGETSPLTSQEQAWNEAVEGWQREQGYVPATSIPPGQRAYPVNTFRNGVYQVGVDIIPGRYSTMGPPVGQRTKYPCTFARLKSVESNIDNPDEVIGIRDIWLTKSTTIKIEATDGAVYSSNCREWHYADPVTLEVRNQMGQ